jgi:hypothetical protein
MTSAGRHVPVGRGTSHRAHGGEPDWDDVGVPPEPIPPRLLAVLASGDATGHGTRMAEALHQRIPELMEAPDLLPETAASCIANVAEIVRVLTDQLPVASVEVSDPARDYVLSLVHRRMPLAVLLRGYRVGQNHLWREFAVLLRDEAGDDPSATAALATIENLLFEYVDHLSDQLVTIYQDELERWVRSPASVRRDTVLEILAGEDVDLGVASRRTGYELRGRHLAVVATMDTPDGEQALESAVLGLVAALDGGDPLLVPIGRTTLWAWIGLGDGTDEDALERAEAHVPPETVRLCAGHPGVGLDGFRSGHEEARLTADLVAAEDPSCRKVASYRTIELLSLLIADLERSRRFVLRQLGPLADPGAGTAGLRETTLSFLEHGGSHTAAARAKHLHKNTVYTRVRRAERLLGRPVVVGDAELQDALRLAVELPERLLPGGG